MSFIYFFCVLWGVFWRETIRVGEDLAGKMGSVSATKILLALPQTEAETETETETDVREKSVMTIGERV